MENDGQVATNDNYDLIRGKLRQWMELSHADHADDHFGDWRFCDLVIVMIKTSTRCELKHCSSIISQRPPSLVGNIYFHLI